MSQDIMFTDTDIDIALAKHALHEFCANTFPVHKKYLQLKEQKKELINKRCDCSNILERNAIDDKIVQITTEIELLVLNY